MKIAALEYKGNLRVESVHLNSNQLIFTDAPKDNNGEGRAHSPTDLFCVSLASCMLTMIGIKTKSLDFDPSGTKAEVHKTMDSDPRKIKQIDIHFQWNQKIQDNKLRELLTQTALNCPVSLSINPDITLNTYFNFE
ncbi:OsmC family protein [Salibacter halophilus]|uniref:OsmC family protein n=1 Tax=Salibacter halophilus TaxID=1803916 RepID=A0A6N6MER2_9FLAO|nr:OsmC family protein [Salibacter halophilus]KAB1066205.1 OsmC family protein [Salibacter halophilus]